MRTNSETFGETRGKALDGTIQRRKVEKESE